MIIKTKKDGREGDGKRGMKNVRKDKGEEKGGEWRRENILTQINKIILDVQIAAGK